jgi:hypothetical protein
MKSNTHPYKSVIITAVTIAAIGVWGVLGYDHFIGTHFAGTSNAGDGIEQTKLDGLVIQSTEFNNYHHFLSSDIAMDRFDDLNDIVIQQRGEKLSETSEEVLDFYHIETQGGYSGRSDESESVANEEASGRPVSAGNREESGAQSSVAPGSSAEPSGNDQAIPAAVGSYLGESGNNGFLGFTSAAIEDLIYNVSSFRQLAMMSRYKGIAFMQNGTHTVRQQQEGVHLHSDVEQSGRAHAASTLQTGRDHSGYVRQHGQVNRASLDQAGRSHTAMIEQIGYRQTASVTQYGAGNRATIIQ